MITVQLLEYISQKRAALAHCYPLPSPLDCVRYALTEVGEYEDAMLALERTGDKRNNPDKERDARKELGQVGEMLGAALVQLDRWELLAADIDVSSQPRRILAVSAIAAAIAEAMCSRYVGCTSPTWTASAFAAWLELVDCHGWFPHELLQERYAQVRAKHCTEAA